MVTIPVVLDEELLDAMDRVARQRRRSRSALVRDVLREHLRRLDVQALEDRDRAGYAEHPQIGGESAIWALEAASTWPE